MTLKNKLLLITIPVIIISIVSIYLLVRLNVKKDVSRIETENTQKLLDLAQLSIENQYKSLEFHKEHSFQMRKNERKDIVSVAISSIQNEYNNYKNGKISEKEAKKKAVQFIQELRYDNGNGYIWINNTEKPIPRIIVHPIYPEFNNKISTHRIFYTSVDSNNIPRLALELCEKHGSGFIEYFWSKPESPERIGEKSKVSYVELFEPWQWILGTGIYHEDIELDVKNRMTAILTELEQTIGNMTISESGYFFIFDSNKDILLHPAIIGQIPDSAIYLSENSPLDGIMNAIKSGRNTYEYYWNNPLENDTEFTHKKKVFVEYFEPLDWYVCASIYEAEIDSPALILGRKILLISLIFFITAVFVSLRLSVSLSKPIRNLAKYVSNIPQLEHDAAIKEIPYSGSQETQALSKAIKEMLIAINEQKQEIVQNEEKYRMLVENSPSVFWITDRKGVTHYISPNIEKVYGFTSEEIYANETGLWLDRIHKQDIEKLKQSFSEIFTNNKILDINYRVKNKEGNWIWIHNTGKRFTGNNGSEIAYGIFHDTTDKIHAEQRVLQAMIQSEEKERSRIAKDLHDGVSPLLSALKLFTQSMNGTTDELIREELSAKISVTIEEAILSLNEISANISPHILQNFGLCKAVEAFAFKVLNQKQIKYKIEANYTERLPVDLETTLYRISIELINNTLKYASAKNIEINYCMAENQVIMNYRDDGAGFDVVNVMNSRTGMGLFNMKNRVKSFDGQSKIISSSGNGVSVEINIPFET